MTAVLGVVLGFLTGPGAADTPRAGPSPTAPVEARAPAARTFPGLDPRRHRVVDGVAVADLADGSSALLTLDAGLQRHLEGVFRRYEVPVGAAVAIEPATGRVLAYVSHRQGEGGEDVVLDPSPPAASVFKIVTGAALLEAGVHVDERVCYHGGRRGISLAHLRDRPAVDRSCATLTEAMGSSINAVFAKLADRHLDPPSLERYASAFGFGHALPFDLATRASAADVPADRLEFARTAAGFWHTSLSPFHGAAIAATVAHGGRLMRPYVVDEVIGGGGRSVYRAEPRPFRSVIGADTARYLGRMMEETVAQGTARRAFFDRAGHAFLPGIRVAGKTGSLSRDRPYRGYTWFVGYAPAEEPTVAVAALVVNGPRWRIKGSYVGREALRYRLVTGPRSASGPTEARTAGP
ncbi:MAG: penicillin-binding transpeptidase domain-containing protein [Sandaracinaceae bacterium]